MKRLVYLATWLYPPWWRQRYARELEALLDDMEPGWRELFDVMNGALTMQFRTRATIAAVCALTGAIIGGFVAMRTPEVYASSATIRFNALDSANPQSASMQTLQASLGKALGGSKEARAATSVILLERDPRQTTVMLTYMDRDAAQAQRVAQNLTAAVTASRAEALSAEVLELPALPTTPTGLDYATTIASGGVIGLLASGVGILLASRRRSLP
jgi:uncharacterized protein involved in exopolysaccharide biosynthesis